MNTGLADGITAVVAALDNGKVDTALAAAQALADTYPD
jgi:hypothetical protein